MKKMSLKKSLQTGKKPYAILGITGGIAAYKSAYLARLMIEKFSVRVIMTMSARKFITDLTFRAISGRPVLSDMFSPDEETGIAHIEEADKTSIIVVAPATADFLARISLGRANDLLSAVVLASTCPVLLAPGMNSVMWHNPFTQENLSRLLGHERFHIVGPQHGKLACGWEGTGKMSDPEEISAFASGILIGGRSLEGKKVVVTAGPTVEDIDPVRYISNRSSGKMGYAIARAASLRKADVILISGPTNLIPPSDTRTVHVRNGAQMQKALLSSMENCDIVFMSAAVADWKPAVYKKDKIRKEKAGERLTLNLARNEDILSTCVKARKGKRPVIVGFSLETQPSKLVSAAKTKLKKKKCDFIVANLAKESLSKDKTSVIVVDSKGKSVKIDNRAKDEIAHALLDMAAKKL